jgi:hypothetical protein
MANMSYCRFRNTLSDFEDCVELLENEGKNLSSDEQRAAFRLIGRAIELAEMFEDMDEEEIKERLKETGEDEED